MKHKQTQIQKQTITLTPSLQNQIKLLSLNGYGVRKELANLIDKLFEKEEKDKTVRFFREEWLIDNYFKNINNNFDYQKEVPLEKKDLKDHLLEQIILLNLQNYEYLIAEYLVDSINEDGRLDPEIDFEDLKSLVLEQFGIRIKKNNIEIILKKIQKLDPVGCGYRNISESLMIQIEDLNLSKLEKIELKDTITNIEKLKVNFNSVKPSIRKKLKELNFSPGYRIGTNENLSIKPDILVLKDKDKFRAVLNDSFMSKKLLDKINKKIEESNLASKEKDKGFLKGLERRQETLLSVTTFLIEKQTNYLNGMSKLIPVTLSGISKSLEISESTVSRILNSKYVQLRNKSFLLNSLLEKKVNGRSGGKDVSPSQLKELILKITTSENQEKPLSDEKIRSVLKKKFSIEIARRTVCKYRKEALLQSSERRKTWSTLT